MLQKTYQRVTSLLSRDGNRGVNSSANDTSESDGGCELTEFGNKVSACSETEWPLKPMKTLLPESSLQAINESLRLSNTAFMREYEGETGRRQPVHTVYGGAHLFKSDSAPRLGKVAERAMAEYAPDFIIFAQTLGLPDVEQLLDVLSYAQDLKAQLKSNPDAAREEHRAAWLAHTIYSRVQEKLEREPV